MSMGRKCARLVVQNTFIKERNLMFHEGDQIASPRPSFDEKEVPKGVKRLMMGTRSAGVLIDVSKSGIKISGYYKDFDTDKLFACIREPVEITSSEFEKIEKSIFEESKPRRKKKKTKEKKGDSPDRVDVPDQEYLDTLPVVTINDSKYYIDANKRERRPVKSPKQVFNF